MVDQKGSQNAKATKRPRLNLFYLNNELHKKIVVNRAADSITCWNYAQRKKVVYSYTNVLRYKRPAFSTQEVAEILNRTYRYLRKCMDLGIIRHPQYVYDMLSEEKSPRVIKYIWSEDDVIEAHQYFSSVHIGRPREDGGISNNRTPSLREVRAIMNNEEMLYVKQGEAFVPSWKAKNI